MSLTYDIFNPDCNIPIYETPTEDIWVNCSTSKERRNAVLAAVVIVFVMVLILIFAETWPIKLGAGVIGVLVVVGILTAAWGFSEQNAKYEWKQYVQRLEGIERDMKVDRPGAIREYRSRVEKQQELDNQRAHANALAEQGRAQKQMAAQGWMRMAGIGRR